VFRKKVFEILEFNDTTKHFYRFVVFSILALIFLNVTAVILETEKFIEIKYGRFLNIFDTFSVIVFTIEYILRIWSCGSNPRYKGFSGKIRYAFTTLALIDLIAILPFYIPLIINFDLRFIRIIRLFRVFRLLKATRYSPAFKMISVVISKKKEELYISLFSVIVLLIFSSSIMYFVEHNAQPEVFSSIPAALWWGVVTFTTVGYGDIYPVTILGKCCAGVISLLSLGLFALPAGILASGFSEYIQKNKTEINCPHCGKKLE
jgi:voltage-gated potassium channel